MKPNLIRKSITNGNFTLYVYAADGRKLRTKQVTAVEGITVALGHTHELTQAETMDVDTTEYVGSWLCISHELPIN